jgi:hypothetical protein
MTVRMTLRALPFFALFTASAFAGTLTINFTSSLLSAGRGQTITFSGSIVNISGTTVFLNSDSLNITAPLTADDTKFFLNSPLSIAPFATTPTFQIFDVTVPLGAPFGLYPGAFDILGGSTPNDLGTVGTAPFAVNVVPEPATVCMLLAGAICLGLIRHRRVFRRHDGNPNINRRPHILRACVTSANAGRVAWPR